MTNVPVGLSNITAIAAGLSHNLALKSDRTVVAWGNLSDHRCQVPAGLSDVIAVAGGGAHSLALKSDGTVVAWGSNSYGQTNVPIGLDCVVAIAAGTYHSLSLKCDHTVVAWGAGSPGQTGPVHYGQSTVPTNLCGVSAIAGGGHHSMALLGGPRVESLPLNQTVKAGSTVELQFAVSGVPTLAYQWLFNATNLIPGATNATLELTNVQTSQSGAYSVVVTNTVGSVTSSPAMLTVTFGPIIVSPPGNQKIWIGGTALFSVTVDGLPPLAYQWLFERNAMPWGTNSALELTNIQTWQAGAYTVVITNIEGATTSTPAMLEVYPPGTVLETSETGLRAAIAVSPTVTFACDGTIRLGDTITNESDTTLDGTGHQVTISGGNGRRVFMVNSNVTFTVVNLTIADGYSAGGSASLNLGGNVNLDGVLFRSNTASITGLDPQIVPQASGGAIFNRCGGTVAARNCSFVKNTARTLVAVGESVDCLVYGGAIRNEAGQIDLRSCVFVDNRASGGAGSAPGMPVPTTTTGDSAFGGAIHNSSSVTADLCTFAFNSASGGNGYGYDIYPYHQELPGYPGGQGSGGAIFNENSLVIARSTLCWNTAAGGHGGMGSPGEATTSWDDGWPGGDAGPACGAAICNLGSLWLARSTMVSNVVTGGSGGAGGGGGGIEMTYGGNGANGGNGDSGRGGALFDSGGASLANCTIAFNVGNGGSGGFGGAGAPGAGGGGSGGAGGNGGAGFGGVDGTCNLVNCTLAYNRGNCGSGGAGGIAGSFPGVPGATGTSGPAWGGTACGPMPNTLIASNSPPDGDSFPDPKLGPLGDNGGSTLTMALLAGSPAIDAGNTSLAPATDQRGFPRPAGQAADIGAFEYGSVMPAITISLSGVTNLTILGSGNADQSCRLLSSLDLTSWVSIATNQIGGNGTVLFYDTCSPGGACRFYRLVMP